MIEAAGSRLLGRDTEFSQVEELLGAAMKGTAGVALITGEAGIGKSTLASAIAGRAGDLGVDVGIGHCLDVSTHVAFGPVREALRDLSLPCPDSNGSQLEVLVQTVADAAAERAIVMVLEDLHWADDGTRDVVRTLAQTARGRLLLVVTSRTDALHRSNPTRGLLLDVTRSPLCQRFELAPLDEEALRQLVERRGGVPSSTELEELLRRSEGNPLYAEELLDASAGGTGLPPRLADLFLARVAALSSATGPVLRTAAVTGTRIDEDLISAVTGLHDTELAAAYAEARDHDVIVVRDDALEFRHALIRDALYEDLLPSERRRLHAECARHLLASCDSASDVPMATWGRLAYHADGAADHGTALLACTRAGQLWSREPLVDTRDFLERALSLWPDVPDAEEVTGIAHAELLRLAGWVLHMCGERDRARALLAQAVDEVDQNRISPLASRVYSAVAANLTTEDPLAQRCLARLLDAAGPEPSAERVEALTVRSAVAVRSGHNADGVEWGSKAVLLAQEIGDLDGEASAREYSGRAALNLGEVHDGIEMMWQAVALYEQVGDHVGSLSLRNNLAWMQALVGSPGGGLEIAAAVEQEARRLHQPTVRQMALEQVAGIEVWRGNLDQAERAVEEMTSLGWYPERTRAEASNIQLARGHVQDAWYAEAACSDVDDSDLPDEATFARRIEVALASGNVRDAAQSSGRYLERIQGVDAVYLHAAGAAYGHLTLRVLAASRQAIPDELPALAGRALRAVEAADDAQWARSWTGAMTVAARACAAALAGQPDPLQWRKAIEILDDLDYRLIRLQFQPYLVEDLWFLGERSDARMILTDTWQQARRMGAGAVAQHCAGVARRLRINLPEQRMNSAQSRLTTREQEVFALIEKGATNRQIAEALFISEKTVSVHVSNVLAKLGATHRGEAAAMLRADG